MTIQEALDYLNQYRNAGNHIHREAMDMAIEALEKQIEYRNRIKSLVDTIEHVCKRCREIHSDDEQCGLCEYDGAYQGESGDWVNECPGFVDDDCFELSREFKNKYIDWEETQNE